MNRVCFSTLRLSLAFALLAAIFSPRLCSAALVLHIHDGANNLGTVDVQTGAVTVIGNMGRDTMTDIAFDPSGDLYGVSFTGLYRINATTGASTLVGSLGLNFSNALVFGQDGTLYMAGFGSNNLYTVDTTTGAATLIGNTGFASAGDLAFNGGALYLSSTSDELIRIALSPTVSGAAVGPFGFSNVFGLATGSDGVLYGVSGTEIFSVNTATGAGTFVRDYAGLGMGGAFGTSFFAEAQPPSEVPEPASIAIFAIGGLGLAWGARRRRAI